MGRKNSCSDAAGVAAATVAMIFGGAGCVTVAYPGPRLPADQVAAVEGRDIGIDAVDGFAVRSTGAKFEVRAGHRVLLVHLSERRQSATSTEVALRMSRGSDATTVCLAAEAKHFYAIENRLEGGLWNPIIVDGNSGIQIPPCGPIGDDHRGDFPCGGALVEESLASGLQKVSGCGVENVYGYDLTAGQWHSVTEQVMFQLNCPGTQLAVHYLGANQVAVDGCGMHAEYLAAMQCASDGRCVFGAWLPSRGGR